ncbi:PTS transporter subunit IIC [Streptococcus dysgalactiae]|uniref:PTS transporter subunit IIC n=1 Tax=Streptococcus dysgalactiae TaxID=1334 RepID=UPI0021E054C1|nr:PTS transporter subunit IIC [Streptococcus dysgalactiae]
MPFGDLATIPFVVCLMAAVFRGNIVRTVIGGAIYMVSILYLTSWAAPLVTASAKAAEFNWMVIQVSQLWQKVAYGQQASSSLQPIISPGCHYVNLSSVVSRPLLCQ